MDRVCDVCVYVLVSMWVCVYVVVVVVSACVLLAMLACACQGRVKRPAVRIVGENECL
jgi:hypothetical protein